MRNKIISALMWLALVCGCGKKDHILLDRLPVETTINPETRILIRENKLLYVKLEGGNLIKGFTKDKTFQTADLFKTFSHQSYTLPQVSNLIEFDGDFAIGVNSR